jgi:hypothetical protein
MVQVDVRLDEIVLRALERTPQLRFQSANEMQTQIQTVAQDGGKLTPAGHPDTDQSPPSPVAQPFEQLLGAPGLKAVVLVAAIVGLIGVSLALASFFNPSVSTSLQDVPVAVKPIDSASRAPTAPPPLTTDPAIIVPPVPPVSGGPEKPTVAARVPTEGIYIRENFDNNDFDHEKWRYDPVDRKDGKVAFTEGSLHYFAPPGPKGRPRFRLKSTFGIDGDFEASLDYRLIQFPQPESNTADTTLDLVDVGLILGGPGGMVYFSRSNHLGAGDGFVVFHDAIKDSGKKTTWKFEPGSVPQGKLRIRRIDNELIFSHLPTGGSVYIEVATVDYGTHHITSVSGCANVPAAIKSPFEVRIDNLEARNIDRKVVRGPFESSP